MIFEVWERSSMLCFIVISVFAFMFCEYMSNKESFQNIQEKLLFKSLVSKKFTSTIFTIPSEVLQTG